MNKSGHLMVGYVMCISFICIANVLWGWFDLRNIKPIIVSAVIILVYCLIADLDSKSSTATWGFIGLSVLGLTYGIILNNRLVLICSLILLALTYIAAEYMPHRGFIHSIIFGILVSVPIYYQFSYQEAVLAFVAFYSHLVADGEFFKLT